MIKSRSILEDFSNSKEFNEVIKNSLTLPPEGVVTSVKTGIIEAKDGKAEIPYASLQCAEIEEYELFSQINRAEQVPTFKVKIKGFNNQSLSQLVGQTIDLSSADISFRMNKFHQPFGIDLVLNISELL